MRQREKALRAAREHVARRGADVKFGLGLQGRVGWFVETRVPADVVVLDMIRGRVPEFVTRVDVEVGDRAFDDAYVVSGAPAGLVVELLDAPTRARMMALELTGLTIWQGRLRVEKGYFYYYAEPEHIEAAIDLAVDVAARLRELAAREERQMMAAAGQVGGPYREMVDLGAVEAQLARRRAEMERAGARLAGREKVRRVMVVAAVVIGFVYVLVFVILGLLGRS